MKKKLEKLFEKIAKSHMELCYIAQELDNEEIWRAEGAMQDVKQGLRDAFEKLEQNA